jgi:hypothetical protein
LKKDEMLKRRFGRHLHLLAATFRLLCILLSLWNCTASSDGWLIERVDFPPYFVALASRSLQLDDTDHPHVVYGKDHLYHRWFEGTSWFIETIEENSTSGYGGQNSIAFDEEGYLHFSYGSGVGGAVGYCYEDATGWHTEIVHDTTTASEVSLALWGHGVRREFRIREL